MRLISRQRLDDAALLHPNAKPTLDHWHRVAKAAPWKNFAQTRQTFRHADQVIVASGRTVTIFNLTDAFRLITVIHYNRGIVYVLKFVTHAEYSKDAWKREL